MNTKCELCGNDKPIELWNKEEREKKGILYSKVIKNDLGNMVNSINYICPVCGLVYIVPKMDRQRCKEFYEREYREAYKLNPDAELRHANAALNSLLGMKALFVPFLDIGASTGKLVSIVKELSKETEYSDKVIGIDAAQENELVQKIDIEDYETDIKFKCVTMLNTLEHMSSPVSVLKKVHKLMDEKSLLYITVPDLYNMNIQLPMDAYLSNAHLYNFSQFTLCAMLEKCGFKPVNVSLVPQEIGNKLCVLSLKSEPKEPKYKKVDVELVKNFLDCANDLFLCKHNIMRGDTN